MSAVMSDLLELELQLLGSYHVRAGRQTQVLYKSSKCFFTAQHLSSPLQKPFDCCRNFSQPPHLYHVTWGHDPQLKTPGSVWLEPAAGPVHGVIVSELIRASVLCLQDNVSLVLSFASGVWLLQPSAFSSA